MDSAGDASSSGTTPASSQYSSRPGSRPSSGGSACNTSSLQDTSRPDSAQSDTIRDHLQEAAEGRLAESRPSVAPGAAAGHAGAGLEQGRKGSGVLTAAQFMQAMVLLNRRCFPRIANGARAWKLLLEHHVQPLADRKHGRCAI